jgi:hypothetical protein
MHDIEKIKRTIIEIAQRPRNVTFSEIEWVVNHLESFFTVKARPFDHGVIFRVHNQRFTVCLHHRGSKQVKPCYVRKFIDAMTELGLYE